MSTEPRRLTADVLRRAFEIVRECRRYTTEHFGPASEHTYVGRYDGRTYDAAVEVLAEAVGALLLPDAEHIHLTRLPDGGWTAVAMEEEDRGHRDYCYAVVDGGSCDCDYPFRPVRWVDVPAVPEDGAR